LASTSEDEQADEQAVSDSDEVKLNKLLLKLGMINGRAMDTMTRYAICLYLCTAVHTTFLFASTSNPVAAESDAIETQGVPTAAPVTDLSSSNSGVQLDIQTHSTTDDGDDNGKPMQSIVVDILPREKLAPGEIYFRRRPSI
jgi:hypothetical protein